jgi:hypothetical protein
MVQLRNWDNKTAHTLESLESSQQENLSVVQTSHTCLSWTNIVGEGLEQRIRNRTNEYDRFYSLHSVAELIIITV